MRPMPELEIRTEKVTDLVPYAGNAKEHPEWHVDQLAKSIDEFGFNDPVAVWHNGGGEMEIVEGHGRVLALKKLGIEECPVICLDHLSEAQRRAYVLVHNKLTMNTGFDFAMLSEELDALAESFDMGEFGFEGFDFANGGGGRYDGEPPEEFSEYDEDIIHGHICPRCGFEFEDK